MEHELRRAVGELTAAAHVSASSIVVKPLLVTVVDDDESVRESLPDLIKEFGFAVRAFSSAEELLASDCIEQTHCLIVDIGMPGMTGFELQHELKRLGYAMPIVFITAQRDERMRTRVLEQGAAECLFKPFSDVALLAAIKRAGGDVSTIERGSDM